MPTGLDGQLGQDAGGPEVAGLLVGTLAVFRHRPPLVVVDHHRIRGFLLDADVEDVFDEGATGLDHLGHLEATRHGHHLNGILAGEQEVAGVQEVQDDGEALHGCHVQVRDGSLVTVLALRQAVEGLEVAAPSNQDVLVCLEHLVTYYYVDVTEDAALALLVQLLQQLVAVGVLIGLVSIVLHLWALHVLWPFHLLVE